MAHLNSGPTVYVITKSCGDNAGISNRWIPGKVGKVSEARDYGPDAPVHHFLVEPQIQYRDQEEAEKRAIELAEANPGNRYYVHRMISGFLAHKPKLDKRMY